MSSHPFRTSALAAILVLSPGGATAHALPLAPSAACPWCGASLAPATTGPSGRIAPAGEPGTPLEITGVVFQADGRTPAAGVVIYAYQANARGVYPNPDGTPASAGDHGTLRGWVRTDSLGRYRFLTVRPAGRDEPAHVNMTVKQSGGREIRIDPVMFDDDRLLTADARARLRHVGGPAIVRVATDSQGVQHVVRNVILERGS